VAAPRSSRHAGCPNDPMLPYEAPTRTAGRSEARWRSLNLRGAVLFIGQPRPAVSAGSTASISQPAKAVSTSSRDAPPTSHRHRLGPKLSSSTVAPGLAMRALMKSWADHIP